MVAQLAVLLCMELASAHLGRAEAVASSPMVTGRVSAEAPLPAEQLAVTLHPLPDPVALDQSQELVIELEVL